MSASPDDLVAMALFVRVVEQRSFTAAARELGMSKSVVSSRIAKLEERLGARLLHRTTRRIALTTDGVRFYERCARVIAEANEVTSALEGSSDQPQGLLRISAPPAFASRYLPSPLASFLKRHPAVRVELHLESRASDPLEDGSDVSLRIASRLEDSELLVRKLAADRLVLCASPTYLRIRGIPWRPQDLVHHDIVSRRAAAPLRFRTAEGPLLFGGTAQLAADEDGFVRESAAAGLGIAAVPVSLVADALDEGTLVEVLENDVDAELSVLALTPHARLVPAKVRAFLDLLVAEWKAPPWSAALLRDGEIGDVEAGVTAEVPPRAAKGKRPALRPKARAAGAPVVPRQDVVRLGKVASLFEAVDGEATDALRRTLERAHVVASEEVGPELVTMNTKLVLRDASGDTREVTIVYPWDAASESGRVSVIAPLGEALLGQTVGTRVTIPGGHGKPRAYTIEKLLYQPEAAGDHHL